MQRINKKAFSLFWRTLWNSYW